MKQRHKQEQEQHMNDMAALVKRQKEEIDKLQHQHSQPPYSHPTPLQQQNKNSSNIDPLRWKNLQAFTEKSTTHPSTSATQPTRMDTSILHKPFLEDPNRTHLGNSGGSRK